MPRPSLADMMARPAVPAAPRAPRITLANVSRGRLTQPRRVVVYGVKGIGKTSLVASAPNPVIADVERGSGLIDTNRVDTFETFDDVLDFTRMLAAEKHDFQTVGYDSLGEIERLVWGAVCQAASVEGIDNVGGGYGKGRAAAVDKWRSLRAEIERLQRDRRVDVYMIGHADVRTVKDPSVAEDYEQFQIRLDKQAAALWTEWADLVLFARYDTTIRKDSRKKVRGVSSGARLLYTKADAGHDAKDRYGLPEVLPLDYAELDAAIRNGIPADAILAEIQRKAAFAPEDIRARALAAAEAAHDDAQKLERINTHLNAYVTAPNAPQGE